MLSSGPVLRDIVLVGGGHSHVGVLRRFAMRPEPGVRLTLIGSDTDTPYSGMLPGYVAGHYRFDEVHIDLRRLAGFAGARFLDDRVVGLDRARQRVLCARRPPIHYDLVSINTGSAPRIDDVEGAELVIPVKPIHAFDGRWKVLLGRVRDGTVRRLAVVGGGAGGVELTLALHHRLLAELRRQGGEPEALSFQLFTADDRLLPTHNHRVRRAFERVFDARAIAVHRGARVVRVTIAAPTTASARTAEARTAAAPIDGDTAGRVIHCADGRTFALDEVVWVTQARGPAWLRETGLALDDSGFIRVGPTLQAIDDPRIFAAGDVAAMDSSPREKAGVYAVRQSRPLADNLRRAIRGQPLRPIRLQRAALALISTGNRHAVASRGALYAEGDWLWWWKDWIDRRFIRQFTALAPMDAADDRGPLRSAIDAAVAAARRSRPPPLQLTAAEAREAITAAGMRCGGCGAKVGATVLSRALNSLQPLVRDDVVVGLDSPDDAAIVRVPDGQALVQSVDFFRAFIDDPWTFGRIAANHALGDIYAMGAKPQTATAIVTVPPGIEAQVEELLAQLLDGAVDVLNAAGCALVGGHTGEGAELALGFAINGLIDADLRALQRKSGMRPGDALILAKPLGTGILLAAHARIAARGRWIDAALSSMTVSSGPAARCLADHGARATTDVTGFGLLGHLVEMTAASGVAARISLSALPLLDGAREMSAAGIQSSLAPANVRLRHAVDDPDRVANDARYPLLFDPQTAGGLLAAVPVDRVDACLGALRRAGYRQASRIGEVVVRTDREWAVQVLN